MAAARSLVSRLNETLRSQAFDKAIPLHSNRHAFPNKSHVRRVPKPRFQVWQPGQLRPLALASAARLSANGEHTLSQQWTFVPQVLPIRQSAASRLEDEEASRGLLQDQRHTPAAALRLATFARATTTACPKTRGRNLPIPGLHAAFLATECQ